MSGAHLVYKFEDKPALDMLRRLEAFRARVMFDDMGEYLDSEVTNRFKQGVDPEGNVWLPSQRALAEGGRTLVDHGHLRDSITHQTFIDGSGVEEGSDMVYAGIHQFGGRTGRARSVTMPARPFIGINAADEDELEAIALDHLRMALQ